MTQRFEHGGSGGGYRNHGCRCTLCTAAHAAAIKRTRRKTKIRLSMPDEVEHGTESTYDRWCCRCQSCRLGKSIAQARRRLAQLEAEHAAASG